MASLPYPESQIESLLVPETIELAHIAETLQYRSKG
jgi:hypothetical protein